MTTEPKRQPGTTTTPVRRRRGLSDRFVADLQRLFSRENESIWEIGDKLAARDLSAEDIEELVERLGVSESTLKSRRAVAGRYPAAKWDRSHASFGVFRELSGLRDLDAERELLYSKDPGSWTVASMQMEIRDRLLDFVPEGWAPTSVARTLAFGDGEPVLKCSYGDRVLELITDFPLAANSRVSSKAMPDGTNKITVRFGR